MKLPATRSTGALLALFLTLAPLVKGQSIEPVIDNDHPRTYTFQSTVDPNGVRSSRVTARNEASVTLSRLPASEGRAYPAAIQSPPPVLRAVFRDQFAKLPVTQLQKVILQFKRTPKIHYLANQTPDGAKTLLEEERTEGSQLQANVVSWIGSHDGQVLDQALENGYLTALVPAGSIPDLANHPDLFGITPELLGDTTTTNDARKITNAGTVWTQSNPPTGLPVVQTGFWGQWGVKGEGITIDILDTGVDVTHPDLAYQADGVTSKIVSRMDEVTDDCEYSAIGDDTIDDYAGHGTSVAGIAAGSGAHSTDLFTTGNYVFNPDVLFDGGFAPAAKLRVFKISRESGTVRSCTDDGSTISNLGLAKGLYDASILAVGSPDIINVSARIPGAARDGTDLVDQNADAAFDRGCPVFAAAGNLDNGVTLSYPPATAHKSLSVGAINSGDLSAPNDPAWNVASYSMRGSTADGRNKPDLAGPTDMSIAQDSEVLEASHNSWSTFGYYQTNVGFSGTSAASPAVAGAAALWESKWKPIGGICTGALYALLLATANWIPIVDPSVSSSTYGQRFTPTPTQFFSQDTVVGAGMVDLLGGNGTVYTSPMGQPVNGQPQTASNTISVPAGSQRLSVADWWPDRKDANGIYQHSQLDLKLTAPNGVTTYTDPASTNVSARVGIQNPAQGTWTWTVIGTSVPTVNGSITQTYNLATAVK